MRRNRRGAVAVTVAAATASLIGTAALATDVGIWYLQRRSAQSAVDAAALTAAKAMAAGASDTAIVAAAKSVTRQNGFVDSSVKVEPTSGASGRFVTASIATPRQVGLARAILPAGSFGTIRASAKARGVDVPGGACVLALVNPLQFAGGTEVQSPNCGFASNSTTQGGCAFVLGSGNCDPASPKAGIGSVIVRAATFYALGGCAGCTTLEASTNTGVRSLAFTQARPSFYQQQSVQNPYDGLSIPNVNSCNSTSKKGGSTDYSEAGTYDPGCYKGFKISSGQTLVLRPGIYYIAGSGSGGGPNSGNFTISGGKVECRTTADALCDGSNGGVAIILTNGSSSQVGSLSISGNAEVNLVAGKGNGSFAGIVFYRDGRAVDSANSNGISINGGAGVILRGAVLAPSTDVMLNGGGGTATSAQDCTTFIVKGLTATGSSGMSNEGCGNYGASKIPLRMVSLFE